MSSSRRETFYGWRIIATAVFTFGLAVGIPYYNLPFFYDYFQKSFGWSLREITLGFPIAALLTLWVGPVLVPRFRPRYMIVIGTGLTAFTFFGLARMNGQLPLYFLLYLLYAVGYLFSGPIPHQILVSYWFHKKRGFAMGAVYVGVGLLGGAGSFLVRGLTDRFGFRVALAALGCLLLIVWPLAIFILRDRPSDLGQFPDGAANPPADLNLQPVPFRTLVSQSSFWLLLIGSFCSIGAIGCINTHMKLVFRDAGFNDQKTLDGIWTQSSALVLWSSIAGRLSIGHFADIFSKKVVMTITYSIVALTILLLSTVSPAHPLSTYVFATVFGFSMGADYMLIPLMAAEQFGVNSLARAMGVILPFNTIGQTWLPFFVSYLRERLGNYHTALIMVFTVALTGAVAVLLLPRRTAASRT